MKTIVTVRFDPYFSILQVLYDDEHVFSMIIDNSSNASNLYYALITKNINEVIAVYDDFDENFIEFSK